MALRGSGTGVQRAISRWFNEKKAENLAYQVVKYRQRNGWSMRDVLRIAHPKQHAKNLSEQHQAIYHYIAKGWNSVGEMPHPDKALQIIWAAERAKSLTSDKEVAKLVQDYRLPWEAIDTKWLNNHLVWEALLQDIKPEALLKNLGRLTSNGFLKPLSLQVKAVVAKLTDREALIANRMHPLKVLVGLRTYGKGKGEKGSLEWTPNSAISVALEDMYYASFATVEPSGKRNLLAIDCSGSMDGKAGGFSDITGMPLTPREGAAAFAMQIARTEKEHHFVGFSSDMLDLKISSNQSLDVVCQYMRRVPAAGTNISAPFIWAMKNKIEVDNFCVITDNEVNSGIHPSVALKEYRQKMGIPAKLVVVGMTSTGFSIAEQCDNAALDIVGYDSSAPTLISNFAADRI